MAKSSTKAANQTRAQKAKALHDANTEKRKDEVQSLKSVYRSEKDNPLLEDLLAKCRKWQQYHIKIAQDGVGARTTGHKLVDGSPEVENIYLTSEQRASHLDKASGIQEIVDYIERMTADATPPDSKVKG